MKILTLNAGSSSLKYKVFDAETLDLQIHGVIEAIGESQGRWLHHDENDYDYQQSFGDHRQAMSVLAAKLKAELGDNSIIGIGHRVVHGGNDYAKHTPINMNVIEVIKDLYELAPLHNPINGLCIQLAQQAFPLADNIAIFDTAFHQTMPEYIYRYPIDKKTANDYQIRRYGFHGSNHHYVGMQAAKTIDKPFEECNFISLHLGNGASSCLIKQGKSFDTSMGMTPLAGLMMGSRCGDIDPFIPLYLLKAGLAAEEIDDLLNKQSGLKGIAGVNDMREIEKRIADNDADAILAKKMYVYRIQNFIGAHFAHVSSLDGLIFTGGVGENAADIRKDILAPLTHMNFFIDQDSNNTIKSTCQRIDKKGIAILVIKGDEELYMATIVKEACQAA